MSNPNRNPPVLAAVRFGARLFPLEENVLVGFKFGRRSIGLVAEFDVALPPHRIPSHNTSGFPVEVADNLFAQARLPHRVRLVCTFYEVVKGHRLVGHTRPVSTN